MPDVDESRSLSPTVIATGATTSMEEAHKGVGRLDRGSTS